MENGNSEQQDRHLYGLSEKEKGKNYRFAFYVVLAILFASILFSGFQSIYIFRLNTGREGILTYTKTMKQSTESDPVDPSSDVTKKATDDLPEPWFSLEEAALIGSSDKTRKSVVDIVEEVSPATVSLSIVGVEDGKEKKIGSGTGFIITEDGYIVTNQHVVVLEEAAGLEYYVAEHGRARLAKGQGFHS